MPNGAAKARGRGLPEDPRLNGSRGETQAQGPLPLTMMSNCFFKIENLKESSIQMLLNSFKQKRQINKEKQ